MERYELLLVKVWACDDYMTNTRNKKTASALLGAGSLFWRSLIIVVHIRTAVFAANWSEFHGANGFLSERTSLLEVGYAVSILNEIYDAVSNEDVGFVHLSNVCSAFIECT